MASASSRMILKSSSAALNLLTKSKPVQLPLRSLPFVESSASGFSLFNQKSGSEAKMLNHQLPVWCERPRSISEETLMAGYSRKYTDIEEDDDEDDSDIDMIDEEDDDEDEDEDEDDEFEDEEDEFVKTKVRTRSHRDL